MALRIPLIGSTRSATGVVLGRDFTGAIDAAITAAAGFAVMGDGGGTLGELFSVGASDLKLITSSLRIRPSLPVP